LEQALIQLGSDKNIEVHLFGGYKGDPEYFKNLVKSQNLNVIFQGKIMPEKIMDALQTCHIGLVTTWNKKDLSYWLALDNKLFHYIHAGCLSFQQLSQNMLRLCTNIMSVYVLIRKYQLLLKV
jgi:hypothetical protein